MDEIDLKEEDRKLREFIALHTDENGNIPAPPGLTGAACFVESHEDYLARLGDEQRALAAIENVRFIG